MDNQEITQISAYRKETFTQVTRKGDAITHDVFTRGAGKKVLVLIQELPGIGQETLSLADRFVAEGYTVVLPHLFGPIGKTTPVANLVRVLCLRKEFSIFAKNASSPVVDYLSGLCTMLKDRHQVPGVAVIGMCLTGNFAISLMATEAVLAGFASQPSLPLFNQSGLHMSPAEIGLVSKKLDQVGPMHCGRFEGDKTCTGTKFAALRRAFNEQGRERIIFHELPGKGHSILTLDFVDQEGHPTREVLEEVIAYFDDQLK